MAFYFFVSLALVALWEMQRPRRALRVPLRLRWFNHLCLAAINNYGMVFLLPIAGGAWAIMAIQNGWGLFNLMPAPSWLAIPVSLVLLDLVFYAQHRLMHRIPFFWRLHRLHHDDRDVDFTTGFRHHPFETIISYVTVLAAIGLIGVPVMALFIFQMIFMGMNIFSHGNVLMPARIEPIVRHVVITPDMHRIHHSTLRRETDSNYGQILSIWDHLFGTYCAQPAQGHADMTLGLDEFCGPKHARLDWMLANPFVSSQK